MVELRCDLGWVELSTGARYRTVYEWPPSGRPGKLPDGFRAYDGEDVVLEAVRRDRGAWRRFWGPNTLEITHRGEVLCSVRSRPLGVRMWLDCEEESTPLPILGGDVPGLPITLGFMGGPTQCHVSDEWTVMLAVAIECVRNWGDYLGPSSAPRP